MSEITFSSNADFVESGDLFKIMELRYSQSMYDDDGCYPAKQPVSNSLELIRWYRNCEVFLSQLSAVEKKCAPLGDNDYEAFEAELRGLVIDPDVFSNFGITEHNRACQEIYDVFKLKEFRALTLHSSLPTEEKLQDLLEGGCKLREKLKSSAWLQHRFNLSNDHQGLLSDLHEFLKITESTYCLAFDIEVTADQFHDNCSVKWLDRAKPIKRLFEEALEFILTRQGDVLRFYVKLEENGVYGYRFHAVVFLRSLKLTEGAWLANFREQLQQFLADNYWLDRLIKPRFTKVLEEFRNNRDLTEKIPSEDEADKLEQEILAEFKSFYHIAFELKNWNSELRKLNPDLKFEKDACFTNNDMQALEYWVAKNLFISDNYIFFNPHIEELQPSIKCWVKPAQKIITPPKLKHKVATNRPTARRGLDQAKQFNHQVAQTNEVGEPAQRRSGEPSSNFYNPNNDFTTMMPLASSAEPKDRAKFKKQEGEKTLTIDVGPPPAELVKNSSVAYTMQDFINYVADGKKGVVEKQVTNKVRVGWAKIFYQNTIRDAVLLKFMTDFEHFIDNLLHSSNAFFSVNQLPNCSPDGLSPVGAQYLVLFFNFHTQQIANKIHETNIAYDYWELVKTCFSIEPKNDISKTPMHTEQIQSLNHLMKKARTLAKDYEKKMQPQLQYLKYADAKTWKKVFEKERILMRFQFGVPAVLNEKSVITSVFNSFKSRLSGKDRQFKDVGYIRLYHELNQRHSLDVLLMFENAKGAENQKELSTVVEDIWIKSVNAEMNKQNVQANHCNHENLVRSVDFIPKHGQMAVKYLYVRNYKAAEDKSVISLLIPYFISQAIFLQDTSNGSAHKLNTSQFLTDLFAKKPTGKKVGAKARGKQPNKVQKTTDTKDDPLDDEFVEMDGRRLS